MAAKRRWSRRELFLLPVPLAVLAAGVLLLAPARPAAADSDCRAVCDCPCTRFYNDCCAFCSTGYYASCTEGFCGANRARCCCYLQGPLREAPGCSFSDCGETPTTACAAGPGTPRRSIPEKRACLDLLGKPGERERWSLVESTPIAGARDQMLSVIAASSPELRADLEACHRQGLLPDDLYGPGGQRSFLYVPPQGAFRLGGRQVRLEIPPGALAGRSGELAVKAQVGASGQVQSVDLLFATDDLLGNLVTAGLGEWLRVVAPGDAAGPFVDVLHLRFGEGELRFAIQTHYSLTERESDARTPRT